MTSSVGDVLRLAAEQRRGRLVMALAMAMLGCAVAAGIGAMRTHAHALAGISLFLLMDGLGLASHTVQAWARQQKETARLSFGLSRLQHLILVCACLVSCIASTAIAASSLRAFLRGHHTIGASGVTYLGCLVAHTLATEATWRWTDVYRAPPAATHSFAASRRAERRRMHLWGSAAHGTCVLAAFLIDMDPTLSLLDPLAGVIVAGCLAAALFPILAYNGGILLQQTPPQLSGQLDKALRDASAMEGILGIKRQSFWALDGSKVCGQLHVRVRHDADPDAVVQHIQTHMAPLIPPSMLAIQVWHA